MEAGEGMNSGVRVIGAEAPSAYHMAPRAENPSQGAGGPPSMMTSPVIVGSAEKKKRGRPRKYGPDGSVTFSASPVSSTGLSSSGAKRGRGKSSDLGYKQPKKMGMDYIGDPNGCSVGTSFMPHIISVNAGEDVTVKVISFSQQGPRAVCILSASGMISNVTVRQHDSSGGTLTYEGRFDILSLSGSFVPVESQGSRSRSGSLNVSLSSPDGRVIGGVVAGLLIAATPVQVVVGSFLPGTEPEHKPKKLKTKFPLARPPTLHTSMPGSGPDPDDGPVGHGPQNSGAQKSYFATSSSFRRENYTTMHSLEDARNSATDINISLPGGLN